jgi:hypothetical protein
MLLSTLTFVAAVSMAFAFNEPASLTQKVSIKPNGVCTHAQDMPPAGCSFSGTADCNVQISSQDAYQYTSPTVACETRLRRP